MIKRKCSAGQQSTSHYLTTADAVSRVNRSERSGLMIDIQLSPLNPFQIGRVIRHRDQVRAEPRDVTGRHGEPGGAFGLEIGLEAWRLIMDVLLCREGVATARPFHVDGH